MSIPQEIIETIRERANLADIVGESVQLKRSGKSLAGLCPFHSEKTASFYVNDEGFFNCFGCGKKGSVFDFVMETRGMTFPEAVRFLAGRVGVEVPTSGDRRDSREVVERRRKLRSLLECAANFYAHELQLHRPAQQYLLSRQIDGETARRFRLGFCTGALLDSKELEQVRPMFPSEKEMAQGLAEGGLVSLRQDGSLYESFRERLMFPITRSDGGVIAFGGRILVDAPNRPKYINSRENPLYSKRRTLYGLSQALPAIRKSRHAFLVEGYMDVLSMVRLGAEATVATCGTALTPDHVLLLKRFVDRVTVVFDGDTAGRKAAAACFETFLNSGILAHAVLLPEGQDPSSLAERGEKQGVQGLEETLVAGRVDLIELFIGEERRAFGEESGPVVTGKIALQVAKQIARVTNAVESEAMIAKVSELLGVSAASIEKLARGFENSGVRPSAKAVGAKPVPSKSKPSIRGMTSVFDPADDNVNVTPEAKQVADPTGPKTLESYFRQLLVAVLCEPALSETILDSPVLLSGEGLPFPPNLLTLLSELKEKRLTGLAARRDVEARPGGEFNEDLQLLLVRHGFDGFGLLEEAKRQLAVGGTQPKKLVQEASNVALRGSLRAEVQKIRFEEAAEIDELKRAELAQKKLLQRRKGEQMRR